MPPLQEFRFLVLAVLLVPLASAAAVALAGRAGYAGARRLASSLALLHLGLAVALAIPTVRVLLNTNETNPGGGDAFRPLFVPGDNPNTHEHETTWDVFPVAASTLGLPPASVQFFIGVDGLNIWLVLLAGVLTYVATLSSWASVRERAGAYYAWVFLLQAAATGAFLSFDVILFYVFFELTLVPAFFLIGSWGTGGGRRDAARKFVLYTFLGSLFTLVGFVGVAVMNPTPTTPDGKAVQRTVVEDRGATVFPQAGPITFNVNHLMRNVATWAAVHEAKVAHYGRKLDAAKAGGARGSEAESAERLEKARTERDSYKTASAWLFFALIAGFAVKTPVIPFHTWLPTAYGEAPPSVTILLTGMLSKLGTLGMLRFAVPLCPDMAVRYGLPAFGFLGAVGIVYAAFCAFGQKDLKLIAAYSSVSHLGLLVLGLFALNPEGFAGAALHMVNHGLTAGAMFAVIAFLHDRYRTTDTGQYGGLIAAFPLYAFFAFAVSFASVGVPGLNNFVSEMLLIGALFTPANVSVTGYGLAAAAGFGIFLSAWYTMTMLRKVFFGPVHTPPRDRPARDCSVREATALGLPVLLCLALGLFPNVVLKTVRADAATLARQVADARGRETPAAAKLEPAPSAHR